MKQTFLVFLFALFLCGSLAAAPFSFNINGSGFSGSQSINSHLNTTGMSEIFNDFSTETPTFKEVATFVSYSYDGGTAYSGLGKQLSAIFEAEGTIINQDNFTFNTGGSLNMYVDDPVDNPNYTEYTHVDDADNPNIVYGANDGKLIGSWTLISGGGELGSNYAPPGVNGNITAKFAANILEEGYFFDNNGNDLAQYSLTSGSAPTLTIGLATTNASLINPHDQGFGEEIDEMLAYDVPFDGTNYVNDQDIGGDLAQVFNASNNGQWRVSVVPEPATMILLGLGLLGLAGISRKKFIKK